MKKYIFVTPDGLSFKPNVDSPTPDFLDIEMFGQDSDASIQDAISQLIEYNEYAARAAWTNRLLFSWKEITAICGSGIIAPKSAGRDNNFLVECFIC